MHARELAEFAAHLATHGTMLVHSAPPIPAKALVQYWTASKCRIDRWGRSLREYHPGPSHPGNTKGRGHALRGICEEVLVSEMLTRVWSAILTAIDSAANGKDAAALAASELGAHLDISNRVLGLISSDEHFDAAAQTELNRLRRITQRWTDLLLGRLEETGNIAPFAHDPARAKDFSQDFTDSNDAVQRQEGWALLTASLRTTFGRHLQGVTSNADLNGRIAGAILTCFPAALFDSIGTHHRFWLLRLSTTASDTQMLVEEFLGA